MQPPALRLCGEPSPGAIDDPATAFRDAYAELYQPIADYLLRRVGDRHATEDLLHEVFLRMHRALGRYQDRGLPLRHWVLRIANRDATRWLLGRRRELERLHRHRARLPDHSPSPELGISAADSARAMLAALPIGLQEIVSLHYLADCPLADIAAVLRVPVGTVKSRLARARELLRSHLAGEVP